MWYLSKQFRNKAKKLIKDSYLPLLRKSLNNPLIINNKGKANLFISQFYPPLLEVDLLDIFNNTSILFQFTIPQDFLNTLLKKKLEKLPNGKALSLNRIANKVLKEVYKELVLYLAEVFTAVAHLRYYFKIKKSITTVALYKDGKADYFFINSYRPITLENIIAKVYKKLLATLIS